MRIWTLLLTIPQSLAVIKISSGKQFAESAGEFIELVCVTHSSVARNRSQVGKKQSSLLTLESLSFTNTANGKQTANVRFNKLRISQNRKGTDKNRSKQFLWIKKFHETIN